MQNRGSLTDGAWCRRPFAAGLLIVAAACSGDSPTESSTLAKPSPLELAPSFAFDEAGNGSGACLLADTRAAGLINARKGLQCESTDIDIAGARIVSYSIDDADPAGGFTPLPEGGEIECIPGQTIYAVTEAAIQNGTQVRYDLGLWINPDETRARGEGALTGTSCLHFNLVPDELGSTTEEDGIPGGTPDQCGDVAAGALATVPLDILVLQCPAGGTTSLTIDACAGWSTSTSGRADRACPVEEDGEGNPVSDDLGFRLGTTPGAKAKCRCEPIVLPINAKGVIRVDKATVPSGNAPSFSFAATGEGFATPFSLTDVDMPHLSGPLDAGTYVITETVPAGWALTGRACVITGTTNPAAFTTTTDGVSVALATGQDVTCTFTNTRQVGSITIVKDAVPNSPQDFDFDVTGVGVPADIDLDDDPSSATPVSESYGSLTAGTRTFTESTTPGWVLTMIACTGHTGSTVTIGSDADFDEGDRAVTIDLAEGEDVACTFTNTANGSITIVKDAQPDGPQDFDFDVTGVGVPADIDLDDDPESATPVSESFGNLTAGARTFTESTTPGWALTMIACTGHANSTLTIGSDGDFDEGDRAVTVDLAQGENVTCTFTNTQVVGSITIVKDAVPNGPQDFDFDVTGIGVPADIDLDDDPSSATPASESFGSLTAGTRTFTESTTPGWVLTMIACTGQTGSTVTIGSDGDFDAGDQAVTIDLAEGEDVTCTFTNTANGSITIAKDAEPDGPQDFDFDVTGVGLPADIDLDDDPDSATPRSETFTNLSAGVRTFTESALGGWTLSLIACTGQASSVITIGSDEDFDAGDVTVSVDLAQGEHVTCTFTNSQ